MRLNLSIEEREEMLPKCPFVYTLYNVSTSEISRYDEKRVPYCELSKKMKSRRFYTVDMYTREGYIKHFKDDPHPPKKCIVDGKVYDIDMVEVITTY